MAISLLDHIVTHIQGLENLYFCAQKVVILDHSNYLTGVNLVTLAFVKSPSSNHQGSLRDVFLHWPHIPEIMVLQSQGSCLGLPNPERGP